MNALAEKYGDKVAILGFPCNQFGHQTNEGNDEFMNTLKFVRPGNGFEPAPAHMSNCHRKLNRSMFHDAPVHELASGTLAPSDWWATQRAVLQRERPVAVGRDTSQSVEH